MLRVLVWQWGRRGAGPLVAAVMARELAAVAGVETRLSLSTGAELLRAPGAPTNHLPVPTYAGLAGFAGRLLSAPWSVRALARRITIARVDVALCAMPAPLDLLMAAALDQAGVPYAVVVHDAQLHPGDVFPLQIRLQDRLVRGASALFALSDHVAAQLRRRGIDAGRPLLMASHPPFAFWPPPPPVGAHGGPFRLLSFGRLLPYKGLDLLADAVARLGPREDLVIRVVGSGPASPELDRLRALPNVTVENRWVPEAEIGTLLGWADGLVLSHREASQSGVAAAALGARRWVVATRVGGLVEQLQDQDMALLSAPEPDALAEAIASLPGRILPEGAGGRPGPALPRPWSPACGRWGIPGVGGRVKPGHDVRLERAGGAPLIDCTVGSKESSWPGSTRPPTPLLQTGPARRAVFVAGQLVRVFARNCRG